MWKSTRATRSLGCSRPLAGTQRLTGYGLLGRAASKSILTRIYPKKKPSFFAMFCKSLDRLMDEGFEAVNRPLCWLAMLAGFLLIGRILVAWMGL